AASVRRLWVLYAALIALGGYLNEMALLVLGAHGVTLLLGRYRTGVLKHWVLAGACGVVVVGPLAALSATQHADVSWIPKPTLGSVGVLFHDYLGSAAIVPVFLVLVAIVALLPAGQPPWWRERGGSLPSVALPLVVVPGALLIVESVVGKALYVDRYVLYGEIGAALLAGAGLYRIALWLQSATGRRWLGFALAVVACVAVLVVQIGRQQFIRTPASRSYNFT